MGSKRKGLVVLLLAAGVIRGQRLEVSPLIGGRVSGSIDYTSAGYSRVDIGNSLAYGFAAGYFLSSSVEAEFQWSRGISDVLATPKSGGPAVKVFGMATGQYFGNFVFHLRGQEERCRPFILVGAGASHFAPDSPATNSLTRPSLGLGGGVKYYFRKNVGLRTQVRWLPINMYTSSSNTWCGSITGCWSMGSAHYLQSLEFMTGVSFRF
ncbi:MAG TPA: hypothetical protein VMH28_27545 [Candidatus Acidoferrales bacterium]|nr:hypothetical protein [Candidatus Acidoferrales bacterium]